MIRFLASRLLQAAFVLLLVSFAVYILIGLMPGDPIDLMVAANPNLTPADAERLKAIYGLDRPLVGRYLAWLGAALQGEFGYSRLFSQPVLALIWPRLLNTLALVGTSLAIALVIALPAGIYAALRRHSLYDNAVNLLCFAGISVPPFWLALLLIMLFSVTLGWLPASGVSAIGGGGFVDRLPYLVMPVMTLSLLSAGGYIRYVRAAMSEALRQDYIRTARAKGADESRIVWGHALRNAMIPIVTILALDIGTLLSGALITETMFAYLGMGKLIYDAILGNDYNLALVGLLFATCMILAGNLLADIAYAALDPRVTFAAAR